MHGCNQQTDAKMVERHGALALSQAKKRNLPNLFQADCFH
jgi:hypothetical protein